MSISALRKWKKCQRRVANAVLRSVPKHKKSELRSAANALAAQACSKGTSKKVSRRSAPKRRGSKRGKRSSSVIPEGYFSRQHIPGFAPYRAPRREEPMFNPEVSY